MAGSAIARFPFEYEGREFYLQFGTNALISLEDRYDKSIQEIAMLFVQPDREDYPEGEAGQAQYEAALAKFRPAKLADIRNLFHAGLENCDHDITSSEAGVMIDALGMEKAATLTMQAMMAAFPDAKPTRKAGGGGGNPKKK